MAANVQKNRVISRALIMFRLLSTSCILLMSLILPAVAQEQAAPPKELVQYIRDAQKAGQNAFQIQQNAVNSGWPSPVVSTALAFVHDQDAATQTAASKPAESKEEIAPAKPATTAPDTNSPASSPASPTPSASAPTAAPEGGVPAGTPKAATETIRPAGVDRGVPSDYRIGAGDVISIDIWKEPEVSVKGAIVRTDGKISMPLLKEVEVVGMTPVQLEKLITERLTTGGFLNTPDVAIIVGGTASKKIYVTGQVKREGPIPFIYNMTIMQALSEAGGLSPYAKKGKIYVLSTVDGAPYKYLFDYNAALKGQKLELNIQLQAGDNIIVP
jgi:polysaccharide export outer membrane protein